MASWSFEEGATLLASWPSLTQLDGSLWDDFKGTNQTMPEPGDTSSDAGVSNNNQWSQLFFEANIGPGEFFIKKEVPESFEGLAMEKSFSVLDVSTESVLLENILSPALSIKEWDCLTPEKVLHDVLLDDVLSPFHCNGEEMNAVDEVGLNSGLVESQLMLSSDMDTFVDDSICCQEIEKEATKSCSLPLSIGTSTNNFELVETSNIIEKEGHFQKFSWDTIDSLENTDNFMPQVRSRTSEAKELPSRSSTSTGESSLDNLMPSSSLALEKLGVHQTSVQSQEPKNKLLYKGIYQQLSMNLDGEDQDLSKLLTELEQRDTTVLSDENSDAKRGMHTHTLKEFKTSSRIHDSEGAERRTIEIAEESEVSSQGCSTGDGACQSLKVLSDQKQTTNKKRKQNSFSKDSYRSSHKNSHIVDSERKPSVSLLHTMAAVHSPPLQSLEVSSVPCFLSDSQQQHLMNSCNFGLPLLASANISSQPIVQELLIHDQQTHFNSATEKLQEELATQTPLAGHIQICDDRRQEVHMRGQHQKKGHALSGYGELIASLTPPFAATLPVGSNILTGAVYDKKELSREATILHQLQATILQLDVEICLLIRDALYRLAKNATERKAMVEGKSSSATPLDLENTICETNSLLGCELQSQSFVDIQTGETKTNVMDRAIADLLFHRRGNCQGESSMVMDPSLSCKSMPSVVPLLNPSKMPPSGFHCSTGVQHSKDMVSTPNISQTQHPHRGVSLETDFVSEITQLPGLHHFDQGLSDSRLRRLPNPSVASAFGYLGSLPLAKSMCADIPLKPSTVFPRQNGGRECATILPLPPAVFQATTPSVNLPGIDYQSSYNGEMIQFGMSNAYPFFGHSNQVKKIYS